jgi:hypothetical protein
VEYVRSVSRRAAVVGRDLADVGCGRFDDLTRLSG